jgi:general stress protein 26
MVHTDEKQSEEKVLSERIKGIKVAMLTTVDENSGILHSRPMVTQKMVFDGDMWFLTRASASKVHEAESHQVNISYVSPDDDRYVSVSGVAQLVRDRQKIDELWRPAHKVWFSGGKDDPDLALLKVAVTNAEYWDSAANKMVEIFQAARPLAAG